MRQKHFDQLNCLLPGMHSEAERILQIVRVEEPVTVREIYRAVQGDMGLLRCDAIVCLMARSRLIRREWINNNGARKEGFFYA